MRRDEAIRTRTVEFVFSDETKDAHGTVLGVEGWVLDRFNKNGVAFYNHRSYSSDPDQVIGTGKAWVEGRQLVGSITFETGDINPVADKIFQKVLSGTLKTVSVGFLPLERGAFGKGDEAVGEANETYYYGKRELLEISVTPLPSNKNALVRAMGTDPIGESMDDTMCVECDIRSFDTDVPPVGGDNGLEDGEDDMALCRALGIEALAKAEIAMMSEY